MQSIPRYFSHCNPFFWNRFEGKIFEYAVIAFYQLVHKVIVQTVCGLIQLVSRFIITIFRRQKFLQLFFVVRAFYCLILLAANLSSCFCVQTLWKWACGTPTFFCVDRFLWIKRFSPFILKHVAILDFVCVKDLMVFSLRFECFVPKKLFVL